MRRTLFCGGTAILAAMSLSACSESDLNSDQEKARITIPQSTAPMPSAAAPAVAPPAPEAAPAFTPRPDIVAAIERGGSLPPLPSPEELPKPENRMPTVEDIARLRAEYSNKK